MAVNKSVSDFVRFTSTLAGRDKVLYFLQYSCRFYIHFLPDSDGWAVVPRRLRLLMAQLILTRKLLRIGNSIDSLQKASSAMRKQYPDAFLANITAIRHLLFAGYLTLDNIHTLQRLDVCTSKNIHRVADFSTQFWFGSAVCTTILQLYCFYKLQKQQKSTTKSPIYLEQQKTL